MRSAAVLVALGLLLSGLATGQPATAAPPNEQRALMTGWNVGAMPRVCTNDGTGTWINCVNVPITDAQPDGTSTVEAGDFNNDGIADVVIGNQNGTLSTCLQDNTGNFTCTANGAIGRHRGIAVADFNNDGNQDLVGAIETGTLMDVCLGDGTGGFTCNRVAAPNGGRAIEAFDVDNDGDMDMIYAAFPGPSAVCTNDGSGTFTCGTTVGAGNNLGVDTGDFNGDGNRDFILAGAGTADEHVCLGNGTVTFTCSVFNAGGYHSQVSVGDIDNDGDDDAVIGGDGTSTLSCLGDGAGGFTCGTVAAAPANVGSVDLGDIDSDGTLDVLFGSVGGVVNQSCIGDGFGDYTCSGIDAPNIWNTQGVLILDPLGPPPDGDVDGVPDASDNCPAVANPAQIDTDGDLSGDACDTDDDDDGLSDVDETGVHGTDPLLVDTDTDTLSDFDEVTTWLTDPLLVDTDTDTLSDADEINIHGTNPLLFDTDGDSWDDAYELANGGDPLAPALPQAILLPTPADITFDVGSFNVSPSAGSGNPVLLAVTGPCTASGYTVTATGVGGCDLAFDEPGDVNWQAAPTVNLTVMITPGVQAITHAPIPPAVFGDAPVTLSAAASSGLPVAITATGPCTVTGVTLSIDGAGTCEVSFDQPGDVDWSGAATVTTTVGIGQAAQTITVTPPTAMTFGGGAQNLSAIATSNLPVAITATGPCAVAGTTVTATGTGTCTLSYDQPGDVDWSAAPTEVASFLIEPAPQVITPDPIADRFFDEGPVTISPAASSGLAVSITTSGACTATGSTITPTGAGVCEVTTTQDGNADWLAASPFVDTFDIAPGRQTIDFDPPDAVVFGDEPVAVNPIASSGLPVALVVDGPCAQAANTVSHDAAGECTITASQPGNDDWAPAAAIERTLVINRAPQAVTATTVANRRFDDAPQPFTFSASSGLTPTVIVTGPCGFNLGTIEATGVGTCDVQVAQAGDGNWLPATPIDQSFTITPGQAVLQVEVSVVGLSDAAQPAAVTVEPAGLDGVEIRYDGDPAVPTEPGDYELTVALNNPDWVADPITETFTVLEPPVVDDELGDQVRFISMSVQDVIDDGLPEPDPDGGATILTLSGLTPGSAASLKGGGATVTAIADAKAIAVLDIAAAFDLANSTLTIVDILGPKTVVTTEDVAESGDSRLELEFVVDEGDDVEAGGVAVDGHGLAPGSNLEVFVHSDPILIGSLQTDDAGSFAGELALPAGLEPGEHRVLVQASTGGGSLTGTWFFAVDEAGDVDRLGDPEVAAPIAEPQPATESDPAPAEAAAPVETSAERVVPTPVQEADPVEVIDEATGLPVFDPVEEPEQAVETSVTGVTIIAATTAAAAGSVAALGSITPTNVATPSPASGSTSNAARSGTGSGSATPSRRRDGETSSGSDDESRGKGKIASGKAKGMGGGIENIAWGDASITWRWPLVAGLDRFSRIIPDRIRPFSPLASRVASDGSTLRALFGSASLAAPALGITLGMYAVTETGGDAIAPSFATMLALILLGIFDASAGVAAAVTFAAGVGLLGGVSSADSVRTVMGVGSLWYAVPLVAGGARKFRRPPAETWPDRWTRVADVVIGSLLGAWTVQTVLKALPGLSGVELPIAEQADQVALLALAALIGRYLLETIAVRAYPERMAATAAVEDAENGQTQQVLSNLFKAAMFVFIIEPYIGLGWPLAVVVGLMVVPSMLSIVKDRFPNSPLLNRILPSGVPAILFFMTVGTTLGSFLSDRIEDPGRLMVTAFIVVSIPGFLSSVAGLFGRDGEDLPVNWAGRAAGANVAVVAVLAIRGIVTAPMIEWVPFAVAPAFLWWAVTAWRSDLEAPEPPEDEPTDDKPELVGAGR